MSYRILFTPLAGGPSDPAALTAARVLAEGFGAHVDVVFCKPDPAEAVPLVGEAMSGAVVEQLIRSAEEDLERRARETKERVAAAFAGWVERDSPAATGTSFRFRSGEGRADELAVALAPLADLLVLPIPPADGSDIEATVVLEAALLNGGRPIYLAPAKAPSALPDSVVIAWNGSAQAGRAVADAMPFLRAAKQVHVVSVGAGKGGETAKPASLVARLGWAGISSTAHAFDAGHGDPGEKVLETAASLGAQLVVMGGYGHGRVREMIFGGTTRHMVSHSGLPVLMSH